MPRKNLVRTTEFPYHVTARANNREAFPIPLPELWSLISSECLVASRVLDLKVHAFVLMPNHFHMMATTPTHDLGVVMNAFMRAVSAQVNLLANRTGHLFGGPYFWSVVSSRRYFCNALKYVYRNPVRAKICERVEDFPYSTLHGLLGSSHLPFPVYATQTNMECGLPDTEIQNCLDWLNRPFSAEALELIQRGLRKKVFGDLMNRNTRRPYELLEQLL